MESLISFQSFPTVDLKSIKVTSISFVSIKSSQFSYFTRPHSCHVFEVHLLFMVIFFLVINIADTQTESDFEFVCFIILFNFF